MLKMETSEQPKHKFRNAYVSKGGGSEPYDVHDNYGTTPKYLANTPKAFHVRVHVNNDAFNPGKKMVVSNKIKTFDNFLDECTDKCKPLFGRAIRCYTSRGRRRIQNLNELNSDSTYVITGLEPFKKHNYTDIKDERRREFRKAASSEAKRYTPVQHQHDPRLRNLHGRAKSLGEQKKAVILKVFVNGEFTEHARTVVITEPHNRSLKYVKEYIQDTLGTSEIRELYRVINGGGAKENFQLLTENDVPSLKTNDHILAVQNIRHLTPKRYNEKGCKNFTVHTSPRTGQGYDPFPMPHSPPRSKGQFSKHKKLPGIGSSNQSQADTMSPYSNAPSHGGRRSDKSKGSRNHRDYDTDEGGVFKAKKQNNAQGAHQVNDTRETRTEKPIDQREAEVVDEEEIHTKEKTTPIPPGTELNKRPSKEAKQNSENGSQSKNQTEVKKGGKSGKEVINKITVLPPIVDEGGGKSNSAKVKKGDKKGDKKDMKDGQVKEAVDKIEGKSKAELDDKKKPKDLEANDVLEMSEREGTPMDLKSNDIEMNKPPLSTTPPHGKLTPAESPKKERVNEDADMNRIDEFDDESFNHYEQNNTSGPVTGDPRSSTPTSQGEARRMREQKENEAAAKIQAGARAYKARKEYQAKKQAKQQDEEARRREQDALRQQEDERREEEERRKAESMSKKKQMDEDKAATKIQASFKGHKARKDFKARQATKQQVCHDKQSKNAKEIEAATKIQSGFRGFKARQDYNNRKKQAKVTDINDNENKGIVNDMAGKKKLNQDEAAVVIQAGYKGYRTRREIAQRKAQEKNEKIEETVDNKSDNDKKQHTAATQIQANFRGFKARKDYTEKKQKAREENDKKEKARVEKESATKIQASFRGFKTRKEVAEKKKKEPQLPDQAPSPRGKDAEDLDKAATKIQAGFKGFKARKEYNAKVIEENIVETDIAQLPDSAVTRSSIKKGQFIQGEAASKIQSAFRVYHARKVFDKGGDIDGEGEINFNLEVDESVKAVFKSYKARQIVKQVRKKNAAAHKIKASYKGFIVRNRNVYPIKSVNSFHSAVRGYITRKLNNVQGATQSTHERVMSVVNGGYYASIIQGLCKGFLTRYTVRIENERLKTKPTSANSIQGPTKEPVTQESDNEITYWQDANIKMYSDKTIRKSAARIQAAIYGYKTRKQFEYRIKSRLKRVNQSEAKGNAVSNVQSCFKSFLVRKSINVERVEKDVSDKAQTSDEEVKKVIETESNLNGVKKENEKINASERGILSENKKIVQLNSSRPTSSRSEQRSGRSLSGRKRPRSSRPRSGRPRSGLSRPSSQSSLNAADRRSADIRHDNLLEDDFKEETPRSSTKLSGTGHSVKSETTLNLSDIKKEQGQGSAKSYSTGESNEQSKSSGCEVEKEGESYREIEDDEGELNSIEKNVNAVGQLQAAFRAYRMRREISELLSGGGELMDITKIDRAVSALKKEFRLRSAKVRRLGSYQFGSEKSEKRARSGQNWWEDNDEEQDEETLHEQEYDDIVNTRNHEDEKNSIGKSDKDVIKLDSERSESAVKIKAAMKGYTARIDLIKRENSQFEAKKTIEAAYRGYRTRLHEDRTSESASSEKSIVTRVSSVRSSGSRTSDGSVRTVFHVQMHSDAINKRCTTLQAAFAAYQTRKVFMSLSKLVEEGNRETDKDKNGQQLERMGSLSETDDFKLRHKSIAKIQAAYESHRIAHESKRKSKSYSNIVKFSGSLNKHMVLPPIQSSMHVLEPSGRPKSGVIINLRPGSHASDRKSKTQPDLFSNYHKASKHKDLNRIEIYIQKKSAATIIQSHARAFLTRHRHKPKTSKSKIGKKASSSIGRKTPVSVSSKSSKVTRESKESKDNVNRSREDKTMTDIVRVRTASIKLEAERRKVIAEKIRLKQQAEAKLREGRTNKVKNVIDKKENELERSDPSARLTPIPSDRSANANDLVLKEQEAAVKIQKVYRGHRTRRQNETKKKLENEYEDWAHRRTDAAVKIQSTWRGYSVRKENFNGKRCDTKSDKNESREDDFSHLENGGLLVINIGRTKSEIERANRLYDNCSMIQMVFRACKVRRDLVVKAAKSRRERNKAASKIQALYKAFSTRHEFKQSVSATRIQSIVKAFLARDNMEERKRVLLQEELKAASLIQATYLSFRKRRENDAFKKERRLNEAADTIKTVSKGLLVRWEYARQWEQRQLKASYQIQASFVGHKEREKIKKRKDASRAVMASLKARKVRQKMQATRSVATIVAGFRSYKDRQEVQKLKDKRRREMDAASMLQAACRARLVRKQNRQQKEKLAKENKAASRIQHSFRGFKARRTYKNEQLRKEQMRESCAIKIQSVYRGFKGREIARKEKHVREMHHIAAEMVNLIVERTFDYIGKRSDSSERIQATVKGYQTRIGMMSKLTDEGKQRTADATLIQAAFRADKDRTLTDIAIRRRKSAAIIQASYRGSKYRKLTNKVTRRGISATLIQAVFRAKHIRKIQDKKREFELMNACATKIQSIYRGYRCRSEIEKEREMIANIEPPPSALISARTRSGKLLSISMDEVLMKNSRAIILFHKKATELQAAFRAYQTRVEMKDRLVRKTTVAKQTPRRVLSVTKRLTKEDLAAILIQKIFRGYRNRKLYRTAIFQRRRLRESAATSLQAAVKGYRVRFEEGVKGIRLEREGLGEVWRKKQDAANVISFAFRSFQHRKEKKALRYEM